MPNFEHLINPEPSPNSGSNPSQNHDPNPGFGPAPGVNPDQIYTEEEQRDVNAITVTIPDKQTPIVVLFGPQSSGKTLVLLRMIRFLKNVMGLSIVPEGVFRPKTDKHYARMCDELMTQAYSDYAPLPTDVISFMLVKVLEHGNPVCQILEAPGEHYFDGSTKLSFPKYINQVRTSSNRKVWVFFVEQDWGANQNERDCYAQKICQMQKLIKPNDKVVFLFNKSDKWMTSQYDQKGRPIIKSFFNNIKDQYPGIFDKFKNTGILKILYGEYNFKAVCFSSGIFDKDATGREGWTLEDDRYCEDLWELIRH